jgi:hypothetical protein
MVKRRFRARGEDGASLLIALAFLTVFGLLIPAIVTLGGTNLLATNRLGEQRTDVYTADGALDGAIQYIRQQAHNTCGKASYPDCSFSTTLNGTTATVSIKAAGSIRDCDRTVNLVASIGATPTAKATVIVRDCNPAAPPPVDVASWQHLR